MVVTTEAGEEIQRRMEAALAPIREELNRLTLAMTRLAGQRQPGAQPPPTPTAGRPIWEIVIEEMRQRDEAGRAKYGVPLQAGNGRDALRDAYVESLDLCVYLRQAMEERAS